MLSCCELYTTMYAIGYDSIEMSQIVETLEVGSNGVSFCNFVWGTIFFQSREGGRDLLQQQGILVPHGTIPLSVTLCEMLLVEGSHAADPGHLASLVDTQQLTAEVCKISGPGRLALGLDDGVLAMILHERFGLLTRPLGRKPVAGVSVEPRWRGDRTSACVFVCGTFEDFALERQRLVKCVLPAVGRMLSGKGLDVSLIDLRRGAEGSNDVDGGRLSIVMSQLALRQCKVRVRMPYHFLCAKVGCLIRTRRESFDTGTPNMWFAYTESRFGRSLQHQYTEDSKWFRQGMPRSALFVRTSTFARVG